MTKIEEAKEAVTIEEMVTFLGGSIRGGSYGAWMPTVCPIHEDNNASASVNEEIGRMKCHGCEFSGDVVDLAMVHLGTSDFVEAADWIIEEWGHAEAPKKLKRWR